MTVLSDAELRQLLLTKELVVHPLLSLGQIKGAKIDLRLGNEIYIIRHFDRPYYDAKEAAAETEERAQYGDVRYITFGRNGIALQPNDFAIAPLFESIRLSRKHIGRLDGRSSLGRLGIVVHATAGGIDPGFSGELTCELSNLGKVPVMLYPLMRIAALTVEEISGESLKSYHSRPEHKYGRELGTMLAKDYEFQMQLLDAVSTEL